MKLHPRFSFHRIRNMALSIVLGVAGCLGAPTLQAQQQALSVDPDHSTARIFIGSRQNPTFFNVGLTRVSGQVILDPDNVEASTFNFKIFAADQNAAKDSDSQALAGFQPVISFQSERVSERRDGSLQVDGELTVTQSEPTFSSSTGEDFSGPVYTAASLAHSSHKASFIFLPIAADAGQDDSSPEPSSAHLLKAQHVVAEPTLLLMVASTSVNGEAFPQLLSSIESAAWPAGINEANCSMPSSVGQDYSGLQCTGTVPDAYPSPLLPIQAGEDYSGIKMAPLPGNQVTIHVGLAVTAGDRSSATDYQARPDTMGGQ